jgi:hypothetical protein
VIHSLKRKPMALMGLVYRDKLFPRQADAGAVPALNHEQHHRPLAHGRDSFEFTLVPGSAPIGDGDRRIHRGSKSLLFSPPRPAAFGTNADGNERPLVEIQGVRFRTARLEVRPLSSSPGQSTGEVRPEIGKPSPIHAHQVAGARNRHTRQVNDQADCSMAAQEAKLQARRANWRCARGMSGEEWRPK